MAQRSKAKIYESVKKLRAAAAKFGLANPDGSLDLPQLLEFLPYVWKKWSFRVCDASEMGSRLGDACPAEKVIRIRLDAYEGMCEGKAEDCFTVAHELGHMVMHERFALARMEDNATFELVEAESEANEFARVLVGYESPANQEFTAQIAAVLEEITSKWSSKKTGSRSDGPHS